MPRTVWIDTFTEGVVATAAQRIFSLMTGVDPATSRFDRMTLTRTIIGIDIARQVHDSGEGSDLVHLGIGIASQLAVSTPTVPNVSVATEFPRLPWIWRGLYRVFGFAADDPAVFTQRVDLDIRSQRKLDNGECFMEIVNIAHEGTSSVINVTGLVRQLWIVG